MDLLWILSPIGLPVNLLSGKPRIIKCARCGASMNGMTSPQPYGEDYRRYQCSAAKIKKTCAAKPVPAKLVEKLVIDKLDDFFANPDNLTNLLTQFQEDRETRQVLVDAKLKSLSSQLATVRKGITNTTNAIARHGYSDALSKNLTALEDEQRDLYSQIAEIKLKNSAPVLVPTREQAQRFIERIKQNLHTQDPILTHQTLLGLIHEVTIDRSGKHIIGRVVYYHAPAKKKALIETVSIIRAPVGAPIYRHSFHIAADIPNSGRPKRPRS